MKTYNVTLITRFEYRDIKVVANNPQDAREKMARLYSNEVEEMTAGAPYVMGWTAEVEGEA
tara:strand:- start:106 stop:288 length:183 start_codon:yes stop_codon:yes gene_type:complete